MSDSYILSGLRTPVGKFLGQLKEIPAPELAATTMRALIKRESFSPEDVDEVILGNVVSAGIGQAPARQAALKAGLPPTVPAVTINKVCGSGLKAVMLADQAIRAGDASLILAGGMESMSRAPHLTDGIRRARPLGEVTLADSLLKDGLWCAFEDCHMGEHAEYTAARFGVSRDDQDAYALQSQQRAAAAIAEGVFNSEIVPVTVSERGSETLVTQDEGPRPETNLEALRKLHPAFIETGTVTAGNASMLSDGAAAVVVADEQAAKNSRSDSLFRIVASYTSGTAPRDLFVAPVSAVRGVLQKAQLTLDEIDLLEINEAFAAQMVACLRELELDSERVNIFGGAIALGHPIGASGARVLVTLLNALSRRNLRYGLASLCLGGGNAVAMIIERV